MNSDQASLRVWKRNLYWDEPLNDGEKGYAKIQAIFRSLS